VNWGVPSQSDLEKLFFLNDADRQLIAKRRGAHNRLGFALLTRFEHAFEIRAACGLREFDQVDNALREWADARAWTIGDGPKAIFLDAVRWLRERDVLLPGVMVLARLVAQVRDEAYQRLWQERHPDAGGVTRSLVAMADDSRAHRQRQARVQL
jgi:Domain of unknown function (DUF4158)